MVDFLFTINERFLLAVRLRHYKQILVEVGVFQKKMGHFKRKFQVEGDIAHQSLLV